MSRPSTPPDWATDANYPAGADPWSGLPTKIVPTAGEIAAGMVPGEGFPAQYFNQIIGNHADWITFLDGALAALFGDGSDGALVFDGSSAVTGCSRSGVHYTLTRDIYASSMTFTGSADLDVAGYRIYCRGTLDTSATALSESVIHSNGQDGISGGAARPTGSVRGSGAGGGGAGGSVTDSGYGGAGGAGNTGTNAGGTVTAPTGLGMHAMLYSAPLFGYIVGLSGSTVTFKAIAGGAGGGQGLFGGTGGAGGGVLCVAAHTLNLKQSADLHASGGIGDPTGSDGGGGGGGVLFVVYVAKNAGITFAAATNVPGGASGTGVAGSNGNVFDLDIGAAAGVSTASTSTKSGKAILAAVDTVTVTFGGADYTTATGANGYRIKTLALYVSDAGDPVKASVTAKTVTTFTVTFDRVVTGELDWETEGSV